MNRLFLLIPSVGDEDADPDAAYLKQVGRIDNEETISILKRIVQSMKLVEGEDYEMFYDEKYLKKLLKSSDKGMPQMSNLLVFFNDAESIQQKGIGNIPLTINGVAVDSGLVNAFVEGEESSKVLINKDALAQPDSPLVVYDSDGKCLTFNVLRCDSKDVYLWFVENRIPQRVLDTNYKKHGRTVKTGKGGAPISALTYPEEQLTEFLKRAVSANKASHRLYFKDRNNDKIIIFWDENLANPTFHAMEVDAGNQEEIQKIYKLGGRRLLEIIDITADFV